MEDALKKASVASKLPPEFKRIIFVRYLDHMLYHRASASTMRPQVRQTVGWLVYECEQYITLTWDHDADPPTLKGGDPKASGLVLLKKDILELKKLDSSILLLQKSSNWNFNTKKNKEKDEFALKSKERKTQAKKRETAK